MFVTLNLSPTSSMLSLVTKAKQVELKTKEVTGRGTFALKSDTDTKQHTCFLM